MTAYILNLLDLAATLYALSHGAAEGNPLMQSVPTMIFYKIFVVGGLCWVLHHFAGCGNKVARWGLIICTVLYGAVLLWHIVNIAAAAA